MRGIYGQPVGMMVLARRLFFSSVLAAPIYETIVTRLHNPPGRCRLAASCSGLIIIANYYMVHGFINARPPHVKDCHNLAYYI